ncbi:MAG TPA: transcription antitermination factor NusB [Chitinophagales bacterium]|nr:transcription antitermination factor NusB [Chitinophagales bacterium]
MLGRRNLRIKVMQALYQREMDHDIPLAKLEGHLKSQIEKSVALYLTDMLYLVQVCQYSMVDKAKRMAKFIKTEEDEKASTTIAANALVGFLQADARFNDMVKKDGISHYINEDIVKALFAELNSKPKYKEYAALAQPTLAEDKEIIHFILKKVFQPSKDLEHHLEELFINYDDDNSLLLHIIGKYVDAFSADRNNTFFQNNEDWEDEKKFALALLAKTVQNSDELVADIQPKLKNWETDRIAVLDLILLKMAVCELKYFPTIPVKVSINEYIDISKLYSTPRSKDFVNGVLDKVKNELVSKGEIKKHGRGLME